MRKRERLCWWCNARLSSISHAEIADHDGRKVLVHKVCERDAKAYVKPVTATTPDEVEISLLTRNGWTRKDAANRLEQDLIDAAEEDGM
jgi:hypothetical protein